jgi:hypothetical protein
VPSPHGVSTRSASAAIPSTNATVCSLMTATAASLRRRDRLIAGFAPPDHTQTHFPEPDPPCFQAVFTGKKQSSPFVRVRPKSG